MPVKMKTVVHLVIIGLLLMIIYNLYSRPVSNFIGRDLVTTKGTGREASDLFAMNPDLACVPGPSEKASYYTRGLTPGGLCGDANFVHDQQRKFTIQSGIGGSLLDF